MTYGHLISVSVHDLSLTVSAKSRKLFNPRFITHPLRSDPHMQLLALDSEKQVKPVKALYPCRPDACGM